MLTRDQGFFPANNTATVFTYDGIILDLSNCKASMTS